MLKSLKQVAIPLEKRLNLELSKELAEFEKLMYGDDEKVESSDPFQMDIEVLSSGRKVYCPNRQNPVRNRKHHVRSLLIH